jgi:nicotinate-nucleotide adenylyltransferase
MKNVGIFGGTFDPVHLGHLELANYAAQYCKLDEIVFIPTAAPPHKIGISITSFQDRVEMLKLAIAGKDTFSISTIEKQLTPPSYTIDTLRLFIDDEQKDNNDYYFIIGVDAFLEISTWKRATEVLRRIHFIVAARKGYNHQRFCDFMGDLQYQTIGSYWYHKDSLKKVYYLDREIQEISSSAIRKDIARKIPSEQFLSPAVYDYIKRHSLYTRER